MVGAEDVSGLCRILFQQLDSEVAETGGTEFLEVAGACLGDGVEEGVPAADIGAEGMLHPDTVAQVNTMGLARTAAVGVILSAGEESREDAVLHVKHRHVLMERELEPLGRSRFEQVEHLSHVQVIADGHAVQALLNEKLGRERIGDIQ